MVVAYPVTRSATQATRHNADPVPRNAVRVVEVRVPPPVRRDATIAPGDATRDVAPDRDVPIAVRPALISEYRPAHINAKDAITFTALRIKEYYNTRHKRKFFEVGDLINLRLHKEYHVPTITSRKIRQQFVGPFKIVKRIERLTYQLELPANMKIHNVIFIAHLEPATDPTKNPYQRRRPPALAVIVEGEEEYEVEKLIKKRSIRRGGRNGKWVTQYLVRWLTYGPESDTWETEQELLRHAKESVQDYEAANSNVALLAYLAA